MEDEDYWNDEELIEEDDIAHHQHHPQQEEDEEEGLYPEYDLEEEMEVEASIAECERDISNDIGGRRENESCRDTAIMAAHVRDGSSSSTSSRSRRASKLSLSLSRKEGQTDRLSDLQKARQKKRKQMEDLFEQMQSIRNQISQVTHELQQLDDDILSLSQTQTQTHQQPPNLIPTQTQNEDILDSPTHSNQPPCLQTHQQLQPQDNRDLVNANVKPLPITTLSQLPIITTKPNSNISTDNHTKRRQSSAPAPAAITHYFSSSNQNDAALKQKMYRELREGFKLQHFRDDQEQIIQATMQGFDVMVIMRTGGGKSLTYQLPAMLDTHKITVVISPLLSLIQDQQDQLNAHRNKQLVMSFTSANKSNHAHQWKTIRAANANAIAATSVRLIYVTPERVAGSKRFMAEMEFLHKHNRLARFVIDECHCACQWGHDFRPDYVKLGILKRHFPSLPLLAVTATASPRVTDSILQILQLSPHKTKIFRSSANRPNLHYSIVHKQSDSKSVIAHMAHFITTNHKHQSGIIYTFSRKEADHIAHALHTQYHIPSKAYHSSIPDKTKQSIHQSWLAYNHTHPQQHHHKNTSTTCQVVVATIAFGMGIHKPNVRFVLHHTLSKSLEAYYQESGRAGRDGQPSNCVLYYNVADVSRMLGMIHGEMNEGSFWSMVRYAQEHGNDNTCRSILLSALGEDQLSHNQHYPNNFLSSSSTTQDATTVEKQVGIQAQILIRLLHDHGKDLQTVRQLVLLFWKHWDTNNDTTFTKSECERLIISLMISNILLPKVIYNNYGSNVYVTINAKNPNVQKILSSKNPPTVSVRFPIPTKSTILLHPQSNGWISTNKTRKRKQVKKPPVKKKAATSKKRTKTKAKKRPDIVEEKKSADVIELVESSSDNDDDIIDYTDVTNVPISSLSEKRRSGRLRKSKICFKEESSDTDEVEFLE